EVELEDPPAADLLRRAGGARLEDHPDGLAGPYGEARADVGAVAVERRHAREVEALPRVRLEGGRRAVDVHPVRPAPVVEAGCDPGFELDLAAHAADGPHDAAPFGDRVGVLDRHEVDDLGDAGLREEPGAEDR